jgi:hypothetical protein
VLANGRCLPTCGRGQFLDASTGACSACDGSCASCAGAGPAGCLACASPGQVLRAGACVDAQCTGNTTVVPGLGVCLSDLVRVPPAPSGSASAAQPLPTLPGLTAPTPPLAVVVAPPRRLAWWEILLMALGCAFIFLAVLYCWRRRARKVRAQRTARFASTKAILVRPSWRERFLGGLFRRRAPQAGPVHLPPVPDAELGAAPGEAGEAIRLMRLRNDEDARHHAEMEKLHLYGAYEYSRRSRVSDDRRSSRAPSELPSLSDDRVRRAPPGRANTDNTHFRFSQAYTESALDAPAQRALAEGSLFSQFTGEPPRAPQPRQPVTADLLGLQSRFSRSTYASAPAPAPARSPAQTYADSFRDPARIEPTPTGSSGGSRNPFRRP